MPEATGARLSPVYVAGCGVVAAVGEGLGKFEAALRRGASGLGRLETFDSPRFQSNLVGAAMPDRDTADPAHWLARAALREAAAEARSVLDAIPSERMGLVLATTKANIRALELLADALPCPDSARRHLQGDLLAEDLALEFGARGPVRCVSTACVSGLIALQQGAALIQANRADGVLVAGVDHLSAFTVAGFTALKAIDPQGCRPFDRDRCGLSPGEAGGAIVLARAGAEKSSKIFIRGCGASNDANHLTGPSRDGAGLAQAIRAALQAARLTAAEIGYVNAHGTGTRYNDAMEAKALQTIFGADCPPVSSFKGMLGHTLGAAGVVETIGCVLAMRGGFLPGTSGLTNPDEGAPASLIRTPRAVAALDHVLKLNTGFGGFNGAVVLSSSHG